MRNPQDEHRYDLLMQTFRVIFMAVLFGLVSLSRGITEELQRTPITEDSEKLTLEAAIQEALTNNPELKAKQQDLELAKAEALKVVWPNPELEGGFVTDALTGNEGEGEWEIGFSQAFPWNRRLTYQKQAAGAFIERTNWEIEDRRRLLTLEVTKAFQQILLLQEHLKALETLVQIDQKLLEGATARYQQGEVSQIETQVAKVKLQQDITEHRHLQSDSKVAVSELNLLRGRRHDAPLMIKGELRYEPINLNLSKLIQQALKNRPDVKIFEAQIRQEEAHLRLAKALRFEDFKATTFFQHSRGRFEVNESAVKDDDKILGFKISVPLPIFDVKKGQIKEATVRRHVAEISRETIIFRIGKEIEQLVTQLIALEETLDSYEKNTLLALDEAIQTVQNAYLQGQVSFFEVIQAQERFIDFKRSYLKTLTDFLNMRASLQAAVGGIFPEEAVP